MRAERQFVEVPKDGNDRRSPFARDRGRVLHSAALRRLAGKTQVVGPDEDAEVTGVPRTRLTHSLEVAQIGRGIAEDLRADRDDVDPDVVDTAGLAHDIGHPPFGHNGERALHELAREAGGFEGNAQTLRILTRLEPKVVDDSQDPSGSCRGLNLTRAVLDACTKYPWTAAQREPGTRKFGVYADDLPVFTWVRAGTTSRTPSLEAQIMDWADDVAYSVHDLEDGVLAGRIVLGWLGRPAERAELAALAAESFSRAAPAELEAAAERLAARPGFRAVADFDGSLAAAAGLKRLTSELVGRFVTTAVEATRRAGVDAFDAPADVRAEVAVLKAAALRWVMRDPARLAEQARQRVLITELTERVHAGAPATLDPAFVPVWEQAMDDTERLRVAVDQVAVFTDAQATARHGRLRAGAGAPRIRSGRRARR